MTTKTHCITATYAYGINGNNGRVDSKPQVTFEWHDDIVAWKFLRRAVRGYRGPFGAARHRMIKARHTVILCRATRERSSSEPKLASPQRRQRQSWPAQCGRVVQNVETI